MDTSEAKEASKGAVMIFILLMLFAVAATIYFLASASYNKWYDKQQRATKSATTKIMTDYANVEGGVPVQDIVNTLKQYDTYDLYYIDVNAMAVSEREQEINGNSTARKVFRYTYETSEQNLPEQMNYVTTRKADTYISDAVSLLQYYAAYDAVVDVMTSTDKAPFIVITVTNRKAGDE